MVSKTKGKSQIEFSTIEVEKQTIFLCTKQKFYIIISIKHFNKA